MTTRTRRTPKAPALQNIPLRTKAGSAIREALTPRDTVDVDYAAVEKRVEHSMTITPAMVAIRRAQYIEELRRISPNQPPSWYEYQADRQPMLRNPSAYPWQYAGISPEEKS